MVVAGPRAQGEPRRPRAAVRLPDRDDENFLRHTVVRWADGAPELDWKPVTITKWQPAERVY